MQDIARIFYMGMLGWPVNVFQEHSALINVSFLWRYRGGAIVIDIMDTQSSAVGVAERAGAAGTDTFSSVSWDVLRCDPVARWNLLKEARKIKDAEKVVPVLYDRLRGIAASEPRAQEALKEDLGDVLAALGIELKTSANQAIPSEEAEAEGSSHVPEQAVVSQKGAAAQGGQGFAGPRPTPTFSVPAPSPKPETQTPSDSTTDTAANEEAPALTLDKIKKEIARIKQEVGLQRFMAALKKGTPEDQEYVAAQNVLNAVGNPSDADTAAVQKFRQAYHRFARAAEHISHIHGRIQETEAPQEIASNATPKASDDTGNTAAADVGMYPSESLAASVETPGWGSAMEDAKGEQLPRAQNTPRMPVAPAISEAAVMPSRVIADKYREPIPMVGEDTEMPPMPEQGQTVAPVAETPAPAPVVEEPVAEQATGEQEATSADMDERAKAVPEGTASFEAAADTAAAMDPEVTKGLEQLLSEWDVFKSSGIFGLGAGGIEHPMYKKLAALPIMAVISGRWEGADPKIINTIKEYMDGWKRECGIDADPEETFEAYLRRVIAKILQIASATSPQ